MISLPRVIVQIIVFCAALSLAAQNYKSDRLKRAADVVGLQISADSLLPDTMMMKKARDGRNVYLRTDPMGNVEQIGVPLFSEVMRILQPSPVYDFLERYLLELNITQGEEHSRLLFTNNVSFLVGQPSTALTIDSSCAFSNEQIDF